MRLLALTLVASLLGFAYGCGSGGKPPRNIPPTIKCPIIEEPYIPDKRKDSISVKLPAPTVTHPEGRKTYISRMPIEKSDDLFKDGNHTVYYTVTDDQDRKATCTITFTVKVIQCTEVPYIRNGRVQCEGLTYGHTCNMSCYVGYKLDGNEEIYCLKTGKWSNSNQQCLAIECPELQNPANSKGYSCTNGRKYGSMCWLICDKENGYAPERSQFTQCRADKSWTNLTVACIDIEAPRIQNCPTQTLVKLKDPDSALTYIRWEKPFKVTDNSGDNIEVEAIDAQATADGGLFGEGVTLVRFTAQDGARNVASTCAFIVRIQTVSCDPPIMDDQHLQTPGCLNFEEGQSCYLQCYLALKLVGRKYITCKKNDSSLTQSKGYWSYGQDDNPPAEKPYCKVHNCTDLRAPNFGAISCDKWELGKQCMISCLEGYDIPQSIALPSNLYSCYSSGRWNSDYVPDCAWRDSGERIRMNGYYYFSGSCWTSRDKIKENFLIVIGQRTGNVFKKYLKVENVNVRCGDEPEDEWYRRKRSLRYRRRGRRRRRRSSYIKFEVNVPADNTVPFSESLDIGRKEVTKYALDISHVSFNISPSRRITPIYFRKTAAVPACKPGLQLGLFHRDSCGRDSGERIRMNGYYYFSGSCWTSRDKIKENFLIVIGQRTGNVFKKYLKVENVNVRCGDEPEDEWYRRKRSLRYRRRGRRRRRRSSYIKFEVNVPADNTVPFSESLDIGRKEVTKYALDISHVSFNISPSRRITPIYFRKTAAVPACKPGLQLGLFHRDSCVPCPSGSFHNVTRDECVACPLGQFQNFEGQSSCQLCPAGKTTITVANNETTACEAMCLPGTFSLSGVVPCGKCPVGTYTPNVNTTSCTPCPTGLTTEQEGADSVAKCLPYDIMLQGPFSTPLEGKTPVQICDFTFAVWIKTVEEASDGVRIEISNPVDGVGLQIDISTDIEVTLNGQHSVRTVNVLDTKWHHVAVIWSQQTIKLYKNNVVVKTQSLPDARKCPSSTDSSMQVAIRNLCKCSFNSYLQDVSLRDLNFLAEAKPSTIGDMTKTCTSFLNGSLFTLKKIEVQSNDRIIEVIPSTCLRPDPCDPNPCGENVCIPGKDNVTCACKRGYTGPKCENPPDYCKDSLCMNNATCYVSDGFACSCPPGFAGKLCERKIADGGWSKWFDWSECSASCGQGIKTRMRFCTNPPPDADGKPCPGSEHQTQLCNDSECPVCNESTLVLGKGVMKTCTKSGERISCSIECQLGKVLPERPFDYVCSFGFWTPTQQTLSCTDPVTPIATGINYTVVYGNDLTSQSEVETSLNRVGHDFTCARNSTCDLEVGSSACSQHVPVCHKYGGTYYGSLIVKKGVPQAPISVVDIQKNDNPYIKPLFDTWNVFAHTSDELVTPTHRPLEMEIVGDQLEVFPYNHPDQAVTVPGQFGKIMKTWKFLDNINWEVRTANYTTFKTTTTSGARKPLFLSAVQLMTCPPGAVTGGVFCMKCPPGKYYVNEECKWCTNGLYQDLPGQFACKVCPAFKTTEVKGSSDVSQCIDTDVSELHILLGMTSPNIGVLDMTDLNYRQMSMTPTLTGNVDYMAYNPKDKTIFFSTQYPSTIGRVEYSGQNILELLTFPDGTVVTGLDVDIGSDLLFYMTNQGVLAAYHIVNGAQWTLLSDLPSSDGLVLDQEFGIYWMETATIRYMHYGDQKPRTLYTDTHTIWGLSINYQENRLMWQSAKRLRSSNMDGSNPQTLSRRFSNRFGSTDEYFFTIIKEGNTQRLMRENRDRTAFVSIHVVPPSTSRMKVINSTIPHTVDQPCLASHSDCEQACLPLNTTARRCFCRQDFTLQSDLMSCRRDFSVDFETTDPNTWYRPMRKDYSIPPSKTLRFNVKACHSAKLALAKTGRMQYVLRLDHRVNNRTRIDLIKLSSFSPKVLLQEKEISLLDCNEFKTFWITWRKDEARRTQALKVGYGSVVGSNKLLNVADAFPYTVNYLQFGVGIHAAAHWQI